MNLTPEQELDQAYNALMKSRGGNAAQSEDNEPAIPNNMGGTDVRQQRADNAAYMDTQYGATEPRDPEDEAATRRAADRQRRIFGEEDDTDLAASQRNKKDEDGDEPDADEIEKALRLYRRMKKSDAATRAIEDSQDAYLRDQRGRNGLGGDADDDIHGEPEDFPQRDLGTEDPDDRTQITNMGRRVRNDAAAAKSRGAQETFYKSAIDRTGWEAEVWDGNEGLSRLADVIGDHLSKSLSRQDKIERVVMALADGYQAVTRKLDKSLKAQAALLQENANLKKSLGAVLEQPVDIPHPGVIALQNWGGAPNADLAKGNKTPGKKRGLTKAQLKSALTKGLQAEVIDPGHLRDFDNQMAKGMSPADWVETVLNDTERAALGL